MMMIIKCLILSVFLFPCTVCDYTSYYADDVYAHRQSIATLDTSAIYEGVLKLDNIAIHVMQNMVNFLASTLAWGVILPFFQVNYKYLR